MRVFFPLVWYPLLAGAGYLASNMYVQSTLVWATLFGVDALDSGGNNNNHAYFIALACLFYLNMEILPLLMSKTLGKKVDDHIPCDPADCNRRAFVVIAAHKASDSLRHTLPTVLAAFPAHRIYVADNGLESDAETRTLCKDLGVVYRYFSVPNKTFALYQTAREIYDAHPVVASHMVLLDDDTHLPPNFFVRTDLLKQPLVAGYCVGITIAKTPPYNAFEHLVDFEYRTISYRNECKAREGTSHFLHGICAVYNTRRMLMVYSKLPTLPHGLPFGEDSFAGLDCRLAGYRLLQDNRNVVTTFCPRRLLPPIRGKGREQGFGASSLWKQRALRWYLSWPRRLPAEVGLAFFYDTGSWVGNVVYRLDLVWYLVIVIVSSFWPFYLIKIALAHHSWAMFGFLHLGLYATAMTTAAIRYAAFPDTLKKGVDLRILPLVPVMNIIVCVLMACSFLLSVLYYIPFRRIDYRQCYANAW